MPLTDNLVASSYGSRHVIFASTSGLELIVFDAIKLPGDCTVHARNNSTLIVTQVNSLALMGEIGGPLSAFPYQYNDGTS